MPRRKDTTTCDLPRPRHGRPVSRPARRVGRLPRHAAAPKTDRRRGLRGGLLEAADVVVPRREDPSDSFPELLDPMGDMPAPVIAISPRRDIAAVMAVFRLGGGYLVEGDRSPCMLSVAVMNAMNGHTHLSLVACSALREGARRMTFPPGRCAGRTTGPAVPARAADHGVAVDGRGGSRRSARTSASASGPSATTSATSTPTWASGTVRRRCRAGTARVCGARTTRRPRCDPGN